MTGIVELNSNFLILVFFVYGLAFFTMGLAVALESRRSTALVLVSSLKYLAAFGILHSAVEWIEMFSLIFADSPLAFNVFSMRVTKLILMAFSTVSLLQFAVGLIITTLRRHHWLRWVPFVLFAGWLFSFVVPHLYRIPSAEAVAGVSSCLQCHPGQSEEYLALSGEWVTSADIWARYLLYLPGSVLAGLAMLSQRPVFKAMRLPALTRYSLWAAVIFGFNAFVAGLVVPPGRPLTASVLNYASFFAVTLVPPQVFRAMAAVGITYCIVRILSIFEIQQRRQLERADRERFEAQQNALEAQLLAKRQLEEWNKELEAGIEQRSMEIEERNKQLAILEERDRIAREMHDSLGQILGYLGLKIIEVERWLSNEEQAKARAGLREMAGAVRGACADVRESILSLRTGLSDGGLFEALDKYLSRFGDQAGVRTEMVLGEGVELQLSPIAEVQLLRIVQEALTNVRKHAGAQRATVTFESVEDGIRISIEDDGRGFEMAQVSQQKGRRFGLHTMRERAEEIGARFSVDTAPGQGTKVIIVIPKAEFGRSANGNRNHDRAISR
ncbi:MAG: sensor histidine kinase [Chloroflexi bacterium]|nr:sensor histidine kinase [Chloroflexota bacterium]